LIRVGTAGWSLPPAQQARFPGDGPHLARYARTFAGVEINSTFRKAHRPQTFARWAASVPPDFRFSLKVPRSITHDAMLVNVEPLIDAFIAELEPLGTLADCLLAQLPPKLDFDVPLAERFLAHLRATFAGGIALEPRHASWFTPDAERLLQRYRIARVAADPPRATADGEPGGWRGLAYFRLHGSPRIYYSSYDAAFLDALALKASALQREGIPTWCIFDNTASGAGTGNALDVVARLGASPP
jgi:uncharacterized protein YecE (DUF72 family)